METKKDSMNPGAYGEPWRGGSAPPAGERAATEARGLMETAQEGLDQAGSYVQDVMDKTREKVGEYREAGVEKIKNDVIKYTREQPVTALLVAAGAGLLLGMLTLSKISSTTSSRRSRLW